MICDQADQGSTCEPRSAHVAKTRSCADQPSRIAVTLFHLWPEYEQIRLIRSIFEAPKDDKRRQTRKVAIRPATAVASQLGRTNIFVVHDVVFVLLSSGHDLFISSSSSSAPLLYSKPKESLESSLVWSHINGTRHSASFDSNRTSQTNTLTPSPTQCHRFESRS